MLHPLTGPLFSNRFFGGWVGGAGIGGGGGGGESYTRLRHKCEQIEKQSVLHDSGTMDHETALINIQNAII